MILTEIAPRRTRIDSVTFKQCEARDVRLSIKMSPNGSCELTGHSVKKCANHAPRDAFGTEGQ